MLTFAQPWAFLALAAVALPILAHMAFRRTTKRHKFPSLRFIRASRIPRTGRKTPVDLLLLFLRILFFILLACLLGDPRWVMPGESGEGQQTVLLLDQSASMAGWRAWDEAQAEVERFLSEAKGEVGFLGFATEPLVQSEIAPTRDLDLVRQAVLDAKPTLARGNPQTAVDRALRIFRSGTESKTLIVVTDLQRSNWQAVAQKLGAEGVRLDLRVVGRSQAQGPNRPGNLTLSNARTAPAGPGKLRIWAQVRNSSDNEVNASLVLELGGEAQEKKQVLVGPHSAAQTQFVVPRGDFATAVVRIDTSGEDAFPTDDSRKLWLKAPPPRRFGFFADSVDASQEERLYLQAVLESAGDDAWDRWILSQENADALFDGKDDATLDVLLMPGTKPIESEDRLKRLVAFMEAGGVVLATPGNPYAATIANLRQLGLLNLGFKGVPGGARDRSEPFRFAPFPPESTLGKVFEGKPARDLQLAALYKYGEIKLSAEDVFVRLRSENDHPLVVERKRGKGRFLFFAFRINESWSDLPKRKSFLPLLVELVKGDGGADRSWPRLEVGERLNLSGETFLAEEPGAFRFRDQFVEVSLPAAETSPEIFTRAEGLGILGADKKSVDSAGAVNSPEEEGKPLWIWFAIACAALFVIENLWVNPRSPDGAKTSDA